MAKDDNSMPIKTSGYPLNMSSDNFSNGGDSETYRRSLPYQMPSLFKNNPLKWFRINNNRILLVILNKY